MSYKGVILVGGPSTGTRFRPLSMDMPKPLFPVAGNAIIYHPVAAMAKLAGMKEILIIGFYEQTLFERFLTEIQIEFPHIHFRLLSFNKDICENIKQWELLVESIISGMKFCGEIQTLFLF
jgi:NDP-sugar pyrophosphorylase family protein